MEEITFIKFDIQEVLGDTIMVKALTYGFNPLWGGILITSLNCFQFGSIKWKDGYLGCYPSPCFYVHEIKF
jgi:hypothetical protein